MRLALQIALVAAVLATAAGALVLLVRQPPSGEGVRVVLPTATPQPQVEWKVYISGAVRNPGVYRVRDGDRLADVIDVSGGTTGEADLSAVNLAVRVQDEDHWHIPKAGETPPPSAQGQVNGQEQRIDLNSAGPERLRDLPGIGEVKAEAIVSYRESNGPFESVEELLEVRGIGPATLEAIRELVEAR